MTITKIIPVLLSVLIIILIAMVQERSKALAALLATMPLTAPLAMWVVYSASKGDRAKITEFTGSMITGMLATAVFVAVTWGGLKLKLPFGWAMLAGWLGWALFAFGLPALVRGLRG